jgi:hypothetical protein
LLILYIQYSCLKGILKLILVIFCISWKLAIGSINDIYETLTRFLSMKLCKWHNSLIILSYLAVFPIIKFLLPGQKFISTLLSDILTILGIIWACKVFLDCFYNYIEKKQSSSRVEKIYVKTSFKIPLRIVTRIIKRLSVEVINTESIGNKIIGTYLSLK